MPSIEKSIRRERKRDKKKYKIHNKKMWEIYRDVNLNRQEKNEKENN